MTKLTNAQRDAIQNIAIRDTFDKEYEAIRDREHDLFERIYNSLVSESERKILAKVPSEWLRQSDSFYINAGGYQIMMRTKKSFPDKWNYSRIDLKDQEMIEEVRAYEAAYDDYKVRRREADKALGNLLKSVTTFERLKQAWPEGKEYWEPLWVAAVTPTNLPSVEVKSINAMLGLPKDVVQAAQAA